MTSLFSLRNMKFGELDAKNEIIKQYKQTSSIFYEAFLAPPHFDEAELLSGSTFFIIGNKGTGKTALLRWLKRKIDDNDESISELVLFKSHITEEERTILSTQTGFSVVERDGKAFSIEQDFKQYWALYIHKTVALLLSQAIDQSRIPDSPEARRYISVFQRNDSWWSRISRILPMTADGSADIKLNLDYITASVNIALKPTAPRRYSSFTELVDGINELLRRVPRSDTTIYVLFDELEVFFERTEQFDRDRRMLRDLMYAIVSFNATFLSAGPRVHVISAVRSEILNSIAKVGQEIVRDVYDYGYRIKWDVAFRNGNHPLLEIIENKIRLSYRERENADFKGDIWTAFFPPNLGSSMATKEDLVYSSLFRPRDIVRRLSTARDYDPSAGAFTQAAFDESRTQYSNGIWQEIYEELLASYSVEEIRTIERLFSGFYSFFFIEELVYRARQKFKDGDIAARIATTSFISTALDDLFQLGAVGNDFVARVQGRTNVRQRWVFRGSEDLVKDERMSVHRSLWKHFSTLDRKGIGKMEIFQGYDPHR